MTDMNEERRKFKTLGSFFDEMTSLKPGQDFIFSGRLAIYGKRIDDDPDSSPFSFRATDGNLSMTLENSFPKTKDWYDRYFISFDSRIDLYVPVLKKSWKLILQDPGIREISGSHVLGEIWGEDSRIYIVPELSS